MTNKILMNLDKTIHSIFFFFFFEDPSEAGRNEAS